MGQIQGGDEIITKGRLEAELQSFFNKIKPLIGTGGRQWPVMPQASSAYANIIVQYIGESVPDSYTHAHFYECVEKNGSYVWEESSITSITDGQDGTNGQDGADGTTFTPSVTVVTNGYELSWSNDGNKQNPQTVTILNGTNGQDGNDGADGQGVPTGGSTGQILAKVSGSDYDTGWINPPEGSSSSSSGSYSVMDSTDLEEIFDGSMPTVENKIPILFDEKGEERKVGWYRLSNGTKKPVYEKSFYFSSNISIKGDDWQSSTISMETYNIDLVIFGYGLSSTTYYPLQVNGDYNNTGHNIYIMSARRSGNATCTYLVFQYTKTTDTPI